MVAMLSKITSKARTVRYFEKDSGVSPDSATQYYAGRDFGHRAASRWFGEGARMLKLRGQVKPDDFEGVLGGKVRGTDIQLGRRVVSEETGKARLEHNPGDDLTFAAPKSVSMAALVHRESDAHDAHDEAVQAALEYAQSLHVETRRNQRRETTGRMVAATFRHDTNRNHDPHLHTHSIIANMTCREDGKWMSIDRGSLSLNLRLIEAVYHNELARNLMESGYKLRPVQHGGLRLFEIEGYSDEVLEAFSTRRQEILRDVRGRGEAVTTASTRRAWRRTRQTKEEITREELHRKWGELVEELGHWNPSSKKERRRARKELRQTKARGIEDPLGRDIEADLYKALDTSIEHLGYHTPVISEPLLKARVMGHLAGRVKMEQIDGAIARMAADGHLIKSQKRKARTAWVTRVALDAERGVVEHMLKGRGRAKAIKPDLDPTTVLRRRLTYGKLTLGQADAVRSILTSTDRVSGVQGYAGTGKTTMLSTMVELAGDRKFIGLAPTVGASILLEAESGIPTQTLQKFLVRFKDIGNMGREKLEPLWKEHQGSVLVVDEASMIGTRQMKELFEITNRLGIERLVLVGDTKQLRSIEAGQPFMQLQEHGMETAVMKDIVRQKHEGLKVPVEMMLAGNVTCALEKLADEDNEMGRLVEAPREDLHQSVAGIYLELDHEQRQNTIVMAQTNHDRQEINAQIREGLVEQGHLGRFEYNGIRYVNRHMTPAQKGDALNYEPGDVIVFHSKYRMESGEDHFTVTAISENGKLHMQSASGHEKDFDPGKGGMAYRFEVFEIEDIDLRENDIVRITRNDPDLRERGVVNGAEATVERIDEESVTLRLAGDADDPNVTGERIKLALDDNALRHIDHGYCRTTYAAQGRTAERVIAMVDSGLGEIADQQNFYVQISRASKEAVVVTDDVPDLVDNLEQRTGERLTAMEAVGDSGWGTGQGMDTSKEIEMPGREEEVQAPEGEIRMPELSLPDHFPPEVVAMLDRIGDETVAVPGTVIEKDLETDREEAQKQSLRQHIAPDIEAETPSPSMEEEEIEQEKASISPNLGPDAEPDTEPDQPHAVKPEPDPAPEPAVGRTPDPPDRAENQPGEGSKPEDTVETETVVPEPPQEDVPFIGEIGTGVIEVPEEELHNLAAGAWLSLPAEVKERTGIFATPERQQGIERIIRKNLEQAKLLYGPSIKVKRLIVPPLSPSETRQANNYKSGDFLVITEDMPVLGIKAGKRVPVTGPSEDGGKSTLRLRVRDDSGKPRERDVDLRDLSDFNNFRTVPMELKAGDKIRWRRGDEELGIKAQSMAKITGVDAGAYWERIQLRTKDGKELELSPYHSIFEGCDYAFNLSKWEFKEKAVENVIAVVNGSNPALSVVRDFRTQLDRKAGNAVLLTNNLERLNSHLEQLQQKSLASGKSVEGLIVGKKGYIANALAAIERERERSKREVWGMRM